MKHSNKRVYVFEAKRAYGGGIFFQSATNRRIALRLALLQTRSRFQLTPLGTLHDFEKEILKEGYSDFTWEE